MARADVKVGFACNNRCVFCAQGHKREGCPMVPFETLLERLLEGRRSCDEVVLTGGEPSARPDIVRVVAAARAMGYRVIQLQTNGRMLAYDRVVEELVKAGVTEFSPALHGATAEVHEALTRAAGSFDQTVAGIRNVRRRGMPVVTNSVVVRANTHQLPALVELLGELGVQQAQLAFVHPVGTAFELFDEVVPRLAEVVEPIRACVPIAERHGMRLVTEAVPLCFLRNMRALAVEDHIPRTTVIDLDGVPFDYSQWRPVEGKAHGEVCVDCAERGECEGPWREYADRFGWEEFQPIRSDEEVSLGDSSGADQGRLAKGRGEG
ncbi:MAG TPA: radical SAM protein [Polyangiaceae bacterium]|nr:radical SAM protein [Polyangiaceae bacterium]